MKTKIIPAQITTVEDKIAANLNLTQIILLMTPVFFGAFTYMAFPPFSHIALYKLILLFIIFCATSFLAIRVKGKLILNWLILILRFNLRPKYYVFDKNDLYSREIYSSHKELNQGKNLIKIKAKRQKKSDIAEKEEILLKELLQQKNFNLSFKFHEKGGLNVISEKI